jgi:hypothetical protein
MEFPEFENQCNLCALRREIPIRTCSPARRASVLRIQPVLFGFGFHF